MTPHLESLKLYILGGGAVVGFIGNLFANIVDPSNPASMVSVLREFGLPVFLLFVAGWCILKLHSDRIAAANELILATREAAKREVEQAKEYAGKLETLVTTSNADSNTTRERLIATNIEGASQTKLMRKSIDSLTEEIRRGNNSKPT